MNNIILLYSGPILATSQEIDILDYHRHVPNTDPLNNIIPKLDTQQRPCPSSSPFDLYPSRLYHAIAIAAPALILARLGLQVSETYNSFQSRELGLNAKGGTGRAELS